jgi:molecular chaperone Hsp33
MLQVLPDNKHAEGLEHLSHLANTLTKQEALSLEPHDILHRLFHQDPIRLFAAETIQFNCGCQRENFLSALVLVPRDELDVLLKKDGNITTHCEFCGTQYQFDSIDIEQIFANDGINRQHDTPQ